MLIGKGLKILKFDNCLHFFNRKEYSNTTSPKMILDQWLRNKGKQKPLYDTVSRNYCLHLQRALVSGDVHVCFQKEFTVEHVLFPRRHCLKIWVRAGPGNPGKTFNLERFSSRSDAGPGEFWKS